MLLIKPFSAIAGDITQKGYEKKRTRLLQQYASKQIGEYFAFLEFIKTPASKQREISSRIIRDMLYAEVSGVKILYMPHMFSHIHDRSRIESYYIFQSKTFRQDSVF